jgi:UDP-N-acetylmuramoyl-L-alanyl-D-glutamate--2,6-diaminopimelate ligase
VNETRLLAAQAEALVARLSPLAGITSDSRMAAPEIAFAAYPGGARDGRAFIGDAIARGAAAVLFEARGFDWDAGWRVPHVAVADLKTRLGFIAAAGYGQPSRAQWMIGDTGTNGKTACSRWAAKALARCGRRAAIVGTLGNGFVDALQPSSNTTPDACVLHALLAQWLRDGASAVAMEVSSHGLEQGRVNGITFDVALFTNLTRDHLDYHGTMEAYGAAKARLFEWPTLATAVINTDDAFGRELIAHCAIEGRHVLSYGMTNADVRPTDLVQTDAGIRGVLESPWGRTEFASGVVGAFNVANLLGVAAVLLASDVALDAVAEALARLQPVPGRMQRAGGAGRPLVVVDYAHTPDALEKVIAALRPVAGARGGRLDVVFGCGGDRDPGKRREMGAIAARLADRVVVTSDNPRSEDPETIIRQVVAGIPSSKHAQAEVDRAQANALAIGRARARDVVLIAGKGHEPYQEIAGVRHPFSDMAQAERALAAWSAP